MSISSNSNKSLLKLVMDKLKATDIDYTIGLYEDSGTYPNGASVAQVGYWNEFGTNHPGAVFYSQPKGKGNKERIKVLSHSVPPRPFLVPGAERSFDKAARQAVLAIANGLGEEVALEKAAQVMKQDIQRYITKLQIPPNAPLTVYLKGSSNPLIDTGKMRRSISYKREK